MDAVNPDLARKIVSQLKRGTCPLEGVMALNVGREPWFVAAAEILEDVQQVGGAVVRFIRGDYGEGKTHFIAMIRALAIERNWVTTYVCLSDEVRLDKFQEVYSSIIRNCTTRGLIEERKGMVDPGDLDGWRWILEEWLVRQKRLHSQDLVFGAAATLAVRERLLASLEQHLRRANPVGDFAAAVKAYVVHRLDRDGEHLEEVLRWFRGEPIRLRDRGVLQSVGQANAKQVLRSLVAFIRAVGYGGLAIFIDEVESVLRYPSTRRRSQAYQNLRELLDNVDGAGGMDGACLYCAAVPQIFVGERGFREYEALRQRVLPVDNELLRHLTGCPGGVDYRGVVVDLAADPLSAHHYRELARKIMKIHACAFAWKPEQKVPEAAMDRLVGETIGRHGGESGRLRVLCREIVQLLEEARVA